MKYISIFDIIGPIMVGPSSSHTAGAIRIGNIARKIYGGTPSNVEFTLYNSFAKTGKGHGTDKGLLGGILGLNVSDSRIRNAYELAENEGLNAKFINKMSSSRHSNAVEIHMTCDNNDIFVAAKSVGAGEIEITKINDFNVNLDGELPTLVVAYKDQPGMITQITSIIQHKEINIASLHCDREGKGETAFLAISLDYLLPEDHVTAISEIENVYYVRNIDKIEK